jgi:acetyl esterase/lipase
MIHQSVHAFAEDDGQPLFADVFAPNARASLPAVLLIYGGAWQSGSRSQYRHWGSWLAENGYVAVAIDYRLSSHERATWPSVLEDARAALDFMRAEASSLGIDPHRLAVMGPSAGGHLASLVALTADSSSMSRSQEEDNLVRSRGGNGRGVRAVIPVYGVFDLREWWAHVATTRQDHPLENLFGGELREHERTCRDASPISWVTEKGLGGDVAWLVVWGADDTIVPEAGQSVAFVRALQSVGARVQTLEIAGAGHFWHTAGDIEQGPNSALKHVLLPFLDRHLGLPGGEET